MYYSRIRKEQLREITKNIAQPFQSRSYVFETEALLFHWSDGVHGLGTYPELGS
jgi:hypothetical protein